MAVALLYKAVTQNFFTGLEQAAFVNRPTAFFELAIAPVLPTSGRQFGNTNATGGTGRNDRDTHRTESQHVFQIRNCAIRVRPVAFADDVDIGNLQNPGFDGLNVV